MKNLLTKLLIYTFLAISSSFASEENAVEKVDKILSGKGWNPEMNSIELIRNINEYLMIKREILIDFDKLHSFLNLLVSKSPFKEKGTTAADIALHVYNYHIKNVDADDYRCQTTNDTRCEFFPARIKAFIEKKQLRFRALPSLLARGSNNYPGREQYPKEQLSLIDPYILGLKMKIEAIPARQSAIDRFEVSSYERWIVKLTTISGYTVNLALPASDDVNYPNNFMASRNPRDPEIHFYSFYNTVFMTAFLESGISIWKSENNIKDWKLLSIYGKGYKQLFNYNSHLKPLPHPKDTYPSEEGFNYKVIVDKKMKPYLEIFGRYYWEVYEI